MSTSNHEYHMIRWREFLAELPVSSVDTQELLSDLESLDSNGYSDWLKKLSSQWRRAVARNVDPLMRSPLHREPRVMPNSELTSFTYERCGSQGYLLERPLLTDPTEYYNSGVTLLRGRSTPFYCLLHAMENLYLPSAEKPFRVASFSLDAKERDILGARGHGAIRWRELKKPLALFRTIRSGGAEAVFVPAVSPDCQWRLDPDQLVTSFRTKLQETVLFLILDLTSVGENFDVRGLLDQLGADGPNFVFAFERQVEHLQLGLNLAEVGRIQTWEKKGGQDALRPVLNLLSMVRSFSGLGLTFRDTSELQIPSFWNPKWPRDYCREKARTNQLVAESLQDVTGVHYQPGGLKLVLTQIPKEAFKEILGESHYNPSLLETESGLRLSFGAYRGEDFGAWTRAIRGRVEERFPKPVPTAPKRARSQSEPKREWKTIPTQAGDVVLPLITIQGKEEGPRLSITAGIHGTEFVGIEVLLELADELKSADFKGALVLCPLANPPSFFGRAVAKSPLDSLNPNRSYPGSPGGRPTERIVNFLTQTLISESDAHLDLHSGEFTERVSPFLSFCLSGQRKTLNERTLDLACNLGISDLAISQFDGVRNSISAGHSLAVPTVLVEVGHGGQRDQEALALTKQVIKNAMAHLGMTEEPASETEPRFWIWGKRIVAPSDGLWFPEVEVGDEVHYGQHIGRIKDPLGHTTAIIRASEPGRILYGLTSLSACAGDTLARIAVPVPDPRS